MQAKGMTAALVAVSIVINSAAVAQSDHATVVVPPSCTPEAQRCFEKLAVLLGPNDGTPSWLRLERAIGAAIEADPQCAAVLWMAVF
jgi:hypothetical protein